MTPLIILLIKSSGTECKFAKIFDKLFPGKYSLTNVRNPSGVFHKISIKGIMLDD